MKDEHLGQLDEEAAQLRLRLLVASLARVHVVEGVLLVVVAEALIQRRLVLQRLRHERVVGDRLCLAFSALDDRLVYAREEPIYFRLEALIEFVTDLHSCFLPVAAFELGPVRQLLLLLEPLKEEYHELMAVVLLHWIELTA